MWSLLSSSSSGGGEGEKNTERGKGGEKREKRRARRNSSPTRRSRLLRDLPHSRAPGPVRAENGVNSRIERIKNRSIIIKSYRGDMGGDMGGAGGNNKTLYSPLPFPSLSPLSVGRGTPHARTHRRGGEDLTLPCLSFLCWRWNESQRVVNRRFKINGIVVYCVHTEYPVCSWALLPAPSSLTPRAHRCVVVLAAELSSRVSVGTCVSLSIYTCVYVV